MSVTVAKTFGELIEKFNPYHDRLGRFTSGGGFGVSSSLYTGNPDTKAVTFSANPKTRAGALAIERHGGVVPAAYDDYTPPKKVEKPKADKLKTEKPKTKKPKEEIPEDPLHPKTLAGVERGKEMTFDEANHGTTNPNYSKGGKYTINCQTCVVANEARRRGYNVTARPKDTREADLLASNTKLAWIDPKTGKNPEFMDGSREITTAKKAKKYLEDNLKEGERYTVEFSWKGRRSSGHIINAFKDSEGVKLYDPQTGKITTGTDVDAYLTRIKYTTSFRLPGLGINSKINLGLRTLRVDNLQFNTELVDKILTKGA